MRRFLTRIPDGGGLAPVINPRSLNPFLYLSSVLGTSGFADGATVNPWSDQSGNGHDAITSAVMKRAGSHTLANGAPAVTFNAANTTNQVGNNSQLGITPSPVLGATLITYGRFYYAVNTFSYGIAIADVNNGNPQCITEGSAHLGAGWRDNAGTFLTATDQLPVGSSIYGSMVWTFNPPSGGTGIGTLEINGVQVLSHVWNYVGGRDGYALAGYNTAEGSKLDVGCYLWYPFALSAGQKAGVLGFLKGQFG